MSSRTAVDTVITIDPLCPNMTPISAPKERRCERCGRQDFWDENDDTWRIAVVNEEKQFGNAQCLHEWDINGSFNPIES